MTCPRVATWRKQWRIVKSDTAIQIAETPERNAAWIRASWPVRLPRSNSNCDTACLGDVLATGMMVKIDSKRADFFEGVVRDRWFYFHVADKLQRIYLVATANMPGEVQ